MKSSFDDLSFSFLSFCSSMKSLIFLISICFVHSNGGENPLEIAGSNCRCFFDSTRNVFSCSSKIRAENVSSNFYRSENSLVNVTISSCQFSTNLFRLPNLAQRKIDHLQIYDVNRATYLVFDEDSLSNYEIRHIFISFTFVEPLTILLVSNGSFSRNSLKTLHVESSYFLGLSRPLSRIVSLESISFIDVDGFSWREIREEIFDLKNLRTIQIGREKLSARSEFANVVSCDDLRDRWTLNFNFPQTCSCEFLSLIKATRRIDKKLFRCENSEKKIFFHDDFCFFQGKILTIRNQTDRICRNCLKNSCRNDEICSEWNSSPPSCLTTKTNDFLFLRRRIPIDDLTNKFLREREQIFIESQKNRTFNQSEINAITTFIIDSNRNQTQISISQAEFYHRTLSQFIERPWNFDVLSASNYEKEIWQKLFLSFDENIKSINDSVSLFRFESAPLSTLSFRFPAHHLVHNLFTWKVDDFNQITTNVSQNQSDENTTSIIVLDFGSNFLFEPNCYRNDFTSSKIDCTNRFSVSAIKSWKLFQMTDRIPEYDVISVIAPNRSQRVSFDFYKKIVKMNKTENHSYDPFYDQLNIFKAKPSCMYLNLSRMRWQEDGCRTEHQQKDKDKVRCICEHLTMFTVFFSLNCAKPPMALFIVSWIGSVLSLISLILALFIFIFIGRIRKTAHRISSSSQIYTSEEIRRHPVEVNAQKRRLSIVKAMLFVLCLLLIIMNVLIIVLTLIKPIRNLTCAIFSALLYYFTLVAFLWKLLFAIQQSLFLSNCLQLNGSHRNLFISYLIIAFFLPFIPLLIMFLKYSNLTFISSTCNFCWLTKEFLLYGLIIPVLTIVILNYVLYIYTMIYLCSRNRQQKYLRSTKPDSVRQKENFKFGLFFATIMGLSWVFGFFLLIPNSGLQLAGNILFSISNSLQGFTFSIMVIFMLEREILHRFFPCCRKKMAKKSDSNDFNDCAVQGHGKTSTFTLSSRSNSNKTGSQHEYDHIYTAPSF